MDGLEHTYIETNGVQLHVVQAGPRDGELVLLLHGFPEFWYGWRKQIAYLASKGYRVWAPDQRGYALSDKPKRVRDYQAHLLAEDIAGLIDASGKEAAILVGHDWGGIVAWRTARTYPHLIKRLVILNAPHEAAMTQQFKQNPVQIFRSSYVGFFQIPRLPEKLLSRSDWGPATKMLQATSRKEAFSNESLARYREAWSQPRAFTSMLNWYRAMARSFSSQDVPNRVSAPTLMIWGAKDKFLGRNLALESLNFCNEGRLVFLESATHWVHLEAAEQVNELIEKFAVDKEFLAGKLVSLP